MFWSCCRSAVGELGLLPLSVRLGRHEHRGLLRGRLAGRPDVQKGMKLTCTTLGDPATGSPYIRRRRRARARRRLIADRTSAIKTTKCYEQRAAAGGGGTPPFGIVRRRRAGTCVDLAAISRRRLRCAREPPIVACIGDVGVRHPRLTACRGGERSTASCIGHREDETGRAEQTRRWQPGKSQRHRQRRLLRLRSRVESHRARFIFLYSSVYQRWSVPHPSILPRPLLRTLHTLATPPNGCESKHAFKCKYSSTRRPNEAECYPSGWSFWRWSSMNSFHGRL